MCLISRWWTRFARCCASVLGLPGVDVPVRERQGPCPSPALVVNGIDVATGAPPVDSVCCRLDLPTHDQIHIALAGSTQP